jgi:hypothetical protein
MQTNANLRRVADHIAVKQERTERGVGVAKWGLVGVSRHLHFCLQVILARIRSFRAC